MTTRTKLPPVNATERRIAAAEAFLAADAASKVAAAARSEARDTVDRVCPQDGRLELPNGSVVNITTQVANKVDMVEATARLSVAVIAQCASSLDVEMLATLRDLGIVTESDYEAIVSTTESRRIARGK